MARRTAVGTLVLLALGGACALSAPAGAQSGEVVKEGFLCRIDLTPVAGFEGTHVDTTDSSKVCADTFISIACRAELDDDQDPGPINRQGVPCQINGLQCGVDSEERLPATRSTLKVDADGTARLNCLHEFGLAPD